MDKRNIARVFVIAAALCCFLAPHAAATTITGYIQFNAAQELWNWTATGQTTTGQLVTGSTIANEMADPAKVRLYNPGGFLMAEYRNYRPEPNGYVAMNNFKTAMQETDGLVAWNLSVMGPASGTLLAWGQTIGATDVLGPLAYPDYDNVGTNWFSQTNLDGIPTWWCEAQADALNKVQTDPKRFLDFVVLEFDDAAVSPQGTVDLWIGGVITANLDELVNDNASYAVLEGRMKRNVWRDDDNDGYFVGPGVLAAQTDCCDTPDAPCFARGMGVVTYPEDPAICDTCVCGVAACAPCARCIHPGAPEFAGDSIDSNCSGKDDPGCFIATASFGTGMEGKVVLLQGLRDRHLLGNDLGRKVVDVYYRYSPAVAYYIEGRPVLKTAVRTALLPVVGASWAMNHQGAVAGLALGMVALGLVLRRKEKMGKTMVLLVAAGFLAISPLSADADVRADMDAVIAQSASCMEAVEALLEAGYPEAEVIPAVLAGCRDGVADVIASAIRSGADPFTVSYAAKGAGVDLREVVSALEGVSGNTAEAGQDTAGFRPPSPPIGISSAPMMVTGTGSSWGQSQIVVSPSH